MLISVELCRHFQWLFCYFLFSLWTGPRTSCKAIRFWSDNKKISQSLQHGISSTASLHCWQLINSWSHLLIVSCERQQNLLLENIVQHGFNFSHDTRFVSKILKVMFKRYNVQKYLYSCSHHWNGANELRTVKTLISTYWRGMIIKLNRLGNIQCTM